MEMDPYKPPAAPEPSPASGSRPEQEPSRADWVGRAWFVLIAVALLYLGGRTLQMRWLLGSVYRATAYNEAFHLHATGMFAAVATPAVLCAAASPVFAGRSNPATTTTARLAGVGPVAWLAGVILLARSASWATDPSSAGLGVPALGLALVAGGLVITLVHYGFVILFERDRMTAGHRVVATVVLVASVAVTYLLVERARAMLPRDSGSFIVFEPLPVEGVLHADLVASVAVAGWLLSRRDRAPGVLALLLVGVVPAVLLRLSTTGVIFFGPVDLHLHDTYFVLGSLHAGGSVVMLIFVAAGLSWLESLIGRRPNRVLTTVGGVVLSVGLHATTLAMLHLGRLGMPRRYVAFPDVMQPGQHALGIAAGVSAVGALLLVVAVLASKSARPTRKAL
jgi:hypothetical protein